MDLEEIPKAYRQAQAALVVLVDLEAPLDREFPQLLLPQQDPVDQEFLQLLVPPQDPFDHDSLFFQLV